MSHTLEKVQSKIKNNISATVRSTLIHLSSYGKNEGAFITNIFPSNRRLMSELDRGRSTIISHISTLEKAGLLIREEQGLDPFPQKPRTFIIPLEAIQIAEGFSLGRKMKEDGTWSEYDTFYATSKKTGETECYLDYYSGEVVKVAPKDMQMAKDRILTPAYINATKSQAVAANINVTELRAVDNHEAQESERFDQKTGLPRPIIKTHNNIINNNNNNNINNNIKSEIIFSKKKEYKSKSRHQSDNSKFTPCPTVRLERNGVNIDMETKMGMKDVESVRELLFSCFDLLAHNRSELVSGSAKRKEIEEWSRFELSIYPNPHAKDEPATLLDKADKIFHLVRTNTYSMPKSFSAYRDKEAKAREEKAMQEKRQEYQDMKANGMMSKVFGGETDKPVKTEIQSQESHSHATYQQQETKPRENNQEQPKPYIPSQQSSRYTSPPKDNWSHPVPRPSDDGPKVFISAEESSKRPKIVHAHEVDPSMPKPGDPNYPKTPEEWFKLLTRPVN